MSASAIRCEPPTAAGQPETWPAAASTSPAAGRERLREVVDGVGRDAGPQATCLRGGEEPAADGGRREHGPQPEGAEGDRVRRRPQGRGEDVVGDLVPALDGRADQAPPPGAVADGVTGLLDPPEQHPGAAVVERVGGLDLRVRPREAVRLERQVAERGGVGAEGVDGRADVVEVARAA
jgi:hypothetical protein